MKVAVVTIRTSRLRRMLDRKLIRSPRLRSKVEKLTTGADVVFSLDEVSDLRTIAGTARPPLTAHYTHVT